MYLLLTFSASGLLCSCIAEAQHRKICVEYISSKADHEDTLRMSPAPLVPQSGSGQSDIDTVGIGANGLRTFFSQDYDRIRAGQAQQVFREASPAPGKLDFVLLATIDNQCVLALARGQESLHLIGPELFGNDRIGQPQTLEISAGVRSIDID